MRVQFINPPFLPRFSRSHRMPAVFKSETMYYPYWLAQAAAETEEKGHEIHLIDCPPARMSMSALDKEIGKFRPDLIVMESSTPSWYSDCEVAHVIKRAHPRIRICLVGNHVTALHAETMERAPAVDFIALGEYDDTIAEIATALEGNRDVSEIAGVVFRTGKSWQRTPERPLLQHLDQLSWVSPIYKRYLTPRNYYFNLSHNPMVQIIAGRGCKSKCFFCAYPQISHGHSYRHRTAENIVSEMLWIQENMPEVKQINFEDDNFGDDRVFARRLGEVAKYRRIRLPFFANVRAHLDRSSLESLKDAGLRICSVGFDSMNTEFFYSMNKNETEELAQTFMENARELGILVHGCFMFGFPGETRKSMRELLKFAYRLNPDSAQFYPLMPYPGTSAYLYYRDRNYLATENFRDWLTEHGMPRCVLNLPGLKPDEIDAFCDRAFIRFHFRLRYLFMKIIQAILQPLEGVRSLIAGYHFVHYLRSRSRLKKRRLVVRPVPNTGDWEAIPTLPKGRMQEIEHARLLDLQAEAEAGK